MTAVRLRVVGPELAACPEDGGRWALYCDHHDGVQWLNGGLIQDTNRRRLAGWRTAIDGRGLTVWCPEEDGYGTEKAKCRTCSNNGWIYPQHVVDAIDLGEDLIVNREVVPCPKCGAK